MAGIACLTVWINGTTSRFIIKALKLEQTVEPTPPHKEERELI